MTIHRLILIAAALCATSAGAEDAAMRVLDATHWTHVAPVSARIAEEESLVEAELPPALLAVAADRAVDLRVAVANTDEEIPHLLRDERPTVVREKIRARVYNRVYEKDAYTRVTVDFGKRVMKNRIVVRTEGFDFRRRVTVEGGYDDRNWETLQEYVYLYRVRHPEKPGVVLYEKPEIPLPDNDFRYLRLTVHNGQDDVRRVDLDVVEAFMEVRNEPPMDTREAVIVQTTHDEKLRRTVIELDLGSRHLPVEDIALEVGAPFFYRRVTLEARDAAEKTAQRKRDDGAVVEMTEVVPWTPVGDTVIYRFGEEPGAEASTSIPWPGPGARYARLIIEDFDNAPLSIARATTRYRRPIAEFPAKPGASYVLYVGNAEATEPQYDLIHYVHVFKERVPGTVGDVTSNPRYGLTAQPEPLWARYGVFAALIAAALVLGFLLWRGYAAAVARDKAKAG